MCYFCFKKRRKADLGFVKMARKRFEVLEGGEDDQERGVWQREGIFLWVKPILMTFLWIVRPVLESRTGLTSFATDTSSVSKWGSGR